MKQFNLKTLNTIFDLIKEEDLSTDFNLFKLKHKLTLIAQLNGDDVTTQAVIDYVMENILHSGPIEFATNEISLAAYYSTTELKDINKLLGLPLENTRLTEKTLDNIYLNKERSPELRELYYQLKWKHFKSPEYYNDVNYQALTNVSDRLQYQKEQQANG